MLLTHSNWDNNQRHLSTYKPKQIYKLNNKTPKPVICSFNRLFYFLFFIVFCTDGASQ